MFFTSFGLVTKGLNILGVIGKVPTPVTIAVFIIIVIGVLLALTGKLPGFRR
jgi:hypothetical protein